MKTQSACSLSALLLPSLSTKEPARWSFEDNTPPSSSELALGKTCSFLPTNSWLLNSGLHAARSIDLVPVRLSLY
jgi:hypothetical protein